MEIKDLLKELKENVASFIERFDDILDMNPCKVCHTDQHLCPNPSCSIAPKRCKVCNGELYLCEKCDSKMFEKYQEYFLLINSIAANPHKYTEEEVCRLLDEKIKAIEN